MGVEASLVSRHYDLMVYDDPVNDINTTTRAYRNKIEDWFNNSLQLRHSPITSRVRVIGTAWHFDDLYARIISQENKRRAEAAEAGKKVVPVWFKYRRQVVEPAPEGVKGQEIVGKPNVLPIWPQRFTKEVIEETKKQVGSYIFGCQYMLDPIPGEQAIFKLDQIQRVSWFDIPDNLTHYMAVDLAASEKDESDYSAITVASFDEYGHMYIRQIVRTRMFPREFLDVIHALQEKWHCHRVAIETQAFQHTIFRYYQAQAALEGWSIPWVEMKRGSTNKVKRFLALQPRVERGQFAIEEGINHAEDLIEEMTAFSLDPALRRHPRHGRRSRADLHPLLRDSP